MEQLDETSPDELSMRSALYPATSLQGMEPTLALLLGTLAIVFILILHTQLSLVVAAGIILAGIPLLKMSGKRDVQYTAVLLRALAKQRYYPATSYINVKAPVMRKQQRIKRT